MLAATRHQTARLCHPGSCQCRQGLSRENGDRSCQQRSLQQRRTTDLRIYLILCIASLAATAVDATDLPSVGRSRFDQVIGVGPVPYPFARLVTQIEAQLEADPGGLPPLKITLIPLGRSLQRSAAAPDFFHFPRVIVAVDSPSKPGLAPLQDRLFIGYQEKSAVLEVISYNEAAGRFEFQIVRDYKQGATPSIHYARRALCLSCHQNAAPIFARPLWDETPANPAIATQLRATGRNFYGVKPSGTDIAYFIDTATDRANLFLVWQQIWRDGCGAEATGTRCRREWFDASLRYALSGVMPAPQAARFTHLQSRWPNLWPRGLPIPNPDVPNRDPLATPIDPPATEHTLNLAATRLLGTQLDHIPAAFEPLNPRPPLEYWKSVDPQRLIAGLASLLNPADVVALDQALSQLPQTPQTVTEQITLPCQIKLKETRRTRFECHDSRNTFMGTWRNATGTRPIGEVTALQIGDALGASDIRLHARAAPTARHVDFGLARARLHARLNDGRRLASARFQFTPNQNSVTLSLQDDYAAVRGAALQALAIRNNAFDSAQWISGLLQTVAPAAPPLRHPEARLPPVQTEPTTVRVLSKSANLFDRHCAQCHHSPDAFPPNFLVGDTAQRERQLDHCAERIFYRLRMWQTAEAQRAKTPMPPLAMLPTRGFNAHTWRSSPELAALTEDAAVRIRRQHGSPESVLTQPYEGLRSCLAPVAH